MVVQVCNILRDRTGIADVALSGGVWQNMTLLNKTIAGLAQDDFTILIHHQVPANDGGLALGQAAIAAHRLPA
jgi:hydrogenase maturation protein HypF